VSVLTINSYVVKQALNEFELGFKRELKLTELKMAETKSELIRWIVGAGFLQTALMTALLLKMSSGL